MAKKLIIIILLMIVCSILIGLSAVILSGGLRYFLYKEISYQYLADNITRGAKSDEKKVLRIFNYIHDNLSAAGGQVIDKDAWNDLVRGICLVRPTELGFCYLAFKRRAIGQDCNA